jgi:16S rRNA (guanine527-N7)-methyltransferase
MIQHSFGFAEAVETALAHSPDDVLDLGSGGGIPGLVLAGRWAGARMTLVEGSTRRASFLEQVCRDLGWRHVQAVARRAEEIGQDPTWREQAGIVVARSFGSPAVTLECGAPLLRLGGLLVVSEPPEGAAAGSVRWPEAVLATLGMASVGPRRYRGFGYQISQKVQATPDRYPRRVGIPTKRPLY